MHVVWLDGELDHRSKPLWPSLNAFVVEMLRRFENGTYSVD